MQKVYLVDGLRTPIGSFLGSLKSVSAADLGATVVKKLIEKNNIDPKTIDEVICGNILPAGVGQGIARQVAIKAGLPIEVPAYSINMACGSGMKAVMNAAAEINLGKHLIIAGGTESMSNAPHLVPSKARQGIKMGEIKLIDHMIYDALTDAYSGVHMGVTAENIATKYGITRQQQDEFAINSQTKAIYAVDKGLFDDETVEMEITEGRNTFTFSRDEYPNRTTSFEKLGKLRAAFVADGTVTAGNASGINDGASFVIVASEEAVKKYNLTPMAELVAVGQGGVDPQIMGMGPVPAIENALKSGNLTISELDYLELNEAFAAQSLGVIKQLSQDLNVDENEILGKCNVNGGAIALGHPVGASGNRILVSLMHILKKNNADLGLASLCIGGGMGTAVIIRNIK